MKKGKFSQGMKLFKYAWDTRGVIYRKVNNVNGFIEQKNVVEFDWRERTNDKLLQEVYKEMITDEDFNDLVTCVLELCEYVGRDPDVWLVDYAKDNIKDKQL